MGPGRSGTTILAGILGEVELVTNVGELRWLWARGLVERRNCGCGRPPADCTVWSGVLDRVLGDSGVGGEAEISDAVRGILAAQRELAARRNRLRVIRSSTGTGGDWPELRTIRSVTSDLCAALAEHTGARVLIDTSKRAQDAAVLAALPDIDHYVLHVVRDPRAVSWSWQRVKANPAAGGTQTMSTRALLPSVVRWTENCIGAELLRRRIPRDRWLAVRYEDFASAPRPTIERVLAFLGLPSAAPFIDDDTVVLNTNHTVAGNPNRFRTGPVTISSDEEWRQRMPRRQALCVVAMTLPLLLRYRYPVRPRARGTDRAS